MECYCFPSLVPYATVTKHLKILYLLSSRCIGIIKTLKHTNTLNWCLSVFTDLCGWFYSYSFQNSRHYVNGVVELCTDFSFVSDSICPMYYKRSFYAAVVGVLFVPLKWSLTCHSP